MGHSIRPYGSCYDDIAFKVSFIMFSYLGNGLFVTVQTDGLHLDLFLKGKRIKISLLALELLF